MSPRNQHLRLDEAVLLQAALLNEKYDSRRSRYRVEASEAEFAAVTYIVKDRKGKILKEYSHRGLA